MSGKYARPREKGKLVTKLAAVSAAALGGVVAFAHPASAAVLSGTQVANLAHEGCPQLSAAGINTAVKIAFRESSWNTNATNRNWNGSVDRGVWQINSVHGSLSTYDPLGNARAMCEISNGGRNWRPWTTFDTGSYASAPGGHVSGGAVGLPVVLHTPPPVVAPAPPAAHAGTYTVRSGDTLSGIAQRHGLSHWWPLYANNRRVIGGNPDLIRPGMVLELQWAVVVG